ncbi:MAG: CHRD domain-containing protein [Candidatus Eisenbacteria bacterium]
MLVRLRTLGEDRWRAGSAASRWGGEGTAAFTLTPSGLVYDITVTGLSGPITAAHFHRAPLGSNGSVVRDIGSSFTGNTASGVWTPQDSQALTPALMCEILAGNIYVNVHTAANPAGEARGQLFLNNDRTSMTATLRGTEEEPPNATTGTGTGVPSRPGASSSTSRWKA